jgi:hypothetical protein
MFGQIDEIKNLAFKYSKQQLGRMVQMGMIDPQKAMMAGMMRDRVAKEDTKPPTTTVAQDVLGAAPQVQQPAQPQQPQMGMPQQAPAPQEPVQMAATGGITSLPVQEQDYAGGGIVAFADGGDTDDGVAHYYEGGTTSPMGRWWKGVGAATPEQQATYAAQQEQQAREQALLARQNQLGGLFGLQQQSPEQQAEYEQIQKELIANRKGLNSLNATQEFPTSTNPNAPVTGSLDMANTTPWIDATGKATVDKPTGGAGTGGRPRLPALNEPTGKIDIKEYNAKPVQELDVLAKERSEAYRKAGIDPDLYKSMIEKEEGKREGLGKRKEEAKGEFLMNLGLGLTQAKRGQEFAALGAGAKEGLASYKDAMKDVRATEEKLDDRINSFRLADQQAKKTGTDADIAKRDRQGELVEAAKIKNIEARNAANAEEAKVGANIYGTKMQAETARYVAQLHANTQKEMNTLVKQGQLDAKVAQVLLTSEKNFMDANANSFIGKPDELARAARAHAMEAAKVYLPNSAVANSSMAPAPAPTADVYKNKYGITPTKG